MAAREALKVAQKTAKPLLSTNPTEARRAVLRLYKDWYRQIPYIIHGYDIPKTEENCREKLREMFMKNAHINDVRIIDMLVIKGQMELKETVNIWKQKNHIMTYWKDTEEPKPKDFLSKFFAGLD